MRDESYWFTGDIDSDYLITVINGKVKVMMENTVVLEFYGKSYLGV